LGGSVEKREIDPAAVDTNRDPLRCRFIQVEVMVESLREKVQRLACRGGRRGIVCEKCEATSIDLSRLSQRGFLLGE
jgi:hypothetical protein